MPIAAAVSFASYNSRRFSRPWIATITAWPIGSRAELTFGSYLGSDNGGVAEVACEIGDLIRYGQKDGRGGKVAAYYAVALTSTDHIQLEEHIAATYFRASHDERLAMVQRWIEIREQKAATLAESQKFFDAWRADSTNREAYNKGLQLEREAKSLQYA